MNRLTCELARMDLTPAQCEQIKGCVEQLNSIVGPSLRKSFGEVGRDAYFLPIMLGDGALPDVWDVALRVGKAEHAGLEKRAALKVETPPNVLTSLDALKQFVSRS